MSGDDEFFSESELLTVRAPVPLRPQCDACGLFRDCRSPKMPVDGRGERKILVVAERPGAEEDREGKPLVGRTGQLVREAFARCDVDMRRDCWITNALICFPNSKTPPPSAVVHCRPNLFKTIRTLDPEVIVLLGGDAVRSLIGQLWKPNTGPIARWVGWRIPSVELNAWVAPTYQPAQMFHDDDPVLKMDFNDHVHAAVECAGTRPHPNGPPDYESRIELIHSADEAAHRLRRYTSGMIAFDFETNMLKPDSADGEIVCCSVCWNGTETISFPWYGSVKSAMRELLVNPAVGKIGYNIKFEFRWTLAKLGVRIRSFVWDGMPAAHVLDPRSGKEGKEGRKDGAGITGLKFQAFVRLGVPDYSRAIEPFLHSKGKSNYEPNRVRDVKLDQLLLYCGMDSLLEWETAQKQMDELGVEELHGSS